MPEEVVAADKWGQIIFYDEWNSLELRWLASTAEAADPDLKVTMQEFADEAVKRKPRTLIVDTTAFHHQWGDDMMQWRDAKIIPRYNEAGIAKFAFIASPSFPGATVEEGSAPSHEGAANFPTGWFKSRQGAYQWLST